MLFAITGHTLGLGKRLIETAPINKNFIGFSRSNGFDISTYKGRKQIVAQSLHADVFINNAYDNHHQTDLLYMLWEEWQNKDKIIVNIGSNTTDGIKRFPHDYSAHKASLDKASEQLSNQNSPCKVVLARFGYLGTERILKKDPVPDYIELDDAVNYILNAVDVCKKYKYNSFTIIPKGI